MLSPAAIPQAAARLAGMAHVTPVLTSRTLNAQCGAEVFLKCENFQRGGAFKFRGAYNTCAQLDAAARQRGVVTHSSGNHAQGLALAAQLLGIPAVVVMPDDSPQVKLAATAGYGARIVTCPAVQREALSRRLAEEEGYTLIHPYDDDRVIAGQGTAAYELFQAVAGLEALFVPVGGGGLISGCALAAAGAAPGCRVIGVEPEAADDANRSWRAGAVVVLPQTPNTLADGLRTRFIGERNLALMRRYVADMTTVSEAEIMAALRFAWERLKIVVEPSGATSLAAILSGRYPVAGRRVGVVISGGNVALDALSRLGPV